MPNYELSDSKEHPLPIRSLIGLIAAREYAEINHISPRTAYTELKDLTGKGLLTAVGKGRGIRCVQKMDDQVTD